jgi:hypothetical protein
MQGQHLHVSTYAFLCMYVCVCVRESSYLSLRVSNTPLLSDVPPRPWSASLEPGLLPARALLLPFSVQSPRRQDQSESTWLAGVIRAPVDRQVRMCVCVCACVCVCSLYFYNYKHTLFFACGSSSSSSSAHSNKNKQAQKNKGEAKKKDSTVMVLLRGVVEYMQAVAVTSKTPFSSSSGADASGAILTSTPAHTNTHTTETATQSGFGMHPVSRTHAGAGHVHL